MYKVKLFLCLAKHRAKKTWGYDSIASCIPYLKIDRDKLTVTFSDCFMSEERTPLVHLIRIWVGFRAGLDVVEKVASLSSPVKSPQFLGHLGCILVTIPIERYCNHLSFKYVEK